MTSDTPVALNGLPAMLLRVADAALGQSHPFNQREIDPALFKHLSVFNHPGGSPSTAVMVPFVFPEPGPVLHGLHLLATKILQALKILNHCLDIRRVTGWVQSGQSPGIMV